MYKTKNIIRHYLLNECLFKILFVEISRNFPSIMPPLYIKRVLKYTRIIAVIPFGSTFPKVENKILSKVKKNIKKKKIENVVSEKRVSKIKKNKDNNVNVNVSE